MSSHDLGKLSRLIILLDILESESHLDSVEEVLDGLAILGELSSGANESLLARELSEGSTANTLNSILQMGVANTLNDLVDVGQLSILVDAVLGNNEALGLHQGAANLCHDLLVLESIVDGALSSVVAVVGSGGMASVDGKELALYEGLEVADPVDALNLGNANVLKRSAVDDPLEELLQRHIKTGIGVLGGHNSVDGRVGVTGSQVVVVKTRGVGVAGVLDVPGQSVGGANGVLASDDVQGRLVVGSAVDALGDDRGDEAEDVGTDGAGDDIGGADLLDEVLLVGAGVDGTVVGDGVLRGTLGANLDDAVRGGFVDLVNQLAVDIGEDDIIAGVVEKAGDKATA